MIIDVNQLQSKPLSKLPNSRKTKDWWQLRGQNRSKQLHDITGEAAQRENRDYNVVETCTAQVEYAYLVFFHSWVASVAEPRCLFLLSVIKWDGVAIEFLSNFMPIESNTLCRTLLSSHGAPCSAPSSHLQIHHWDWWPEGCTGHSQSKSACRYSKR